MYPSKVNSSLVSTCNCLKWAIVKAIFKIELDISTQWIIEEITNCPVNASKQKKRKKEKKNTRISTLAF